MTISVITLNELDNPPFKNTIMTRTILSILIFSVVIFALLPVGVGEFLTAFAGAFALVVIMNYSAQKIAENEGGEDFL